MQKFFAYVFPVMGGLFMIWFPAGLQLTFCTTALLASTQAALFSSPRFRNLVGMQPLPKPASPNPLQYQAPSSASPAAPKAPTGLFGGVKTALSDYQKKYSHLAPGKVESSKDRLTDAEKRHAKTYEERRQKEIAREATINRRLAQAKFERQQERMVREREREEDLQRRAEKKARRR